MQDKDILYTFIKFCTCMLRFYKVMTYLIFGLDSAQANAKKQIWRPIVRLLLELFITIISSKCSICV